MQKMVPNVVLIIKSASSPSVFAESKKKITTYIFYMNF